jgi:hypothetical protein
MELKSKLMIYLLQDDNIAALKTQLHKTNILAFSEVRIGAQAFAQQSLAYSGRTLHKII